MRWDEESFPEGPASQECRYCHKSPLWFNEVVYSSGKVGVRLVNQRNHPHTCLEYSLYQFEHWGELTK